MRLTVLGSGSTGNAVLLVANGTRVLVDAGLSAKEVARRMAGMGEDPNSLDAILITHEHGDHAGGLRVLMKDLDCPVFMSARTRDAYVCVGIANDEPRRRADALRNRLVEIDSGTDFRIGGIDFHPFTVPHDAVDNFGFTATHDGVKVATLMDFGHITTLITEQLRGCAAIVIESNHSRDMPIAHAEGNYVCDDGTLAELQRDERIIFRYCDDQGNITDAANVNGSRDNIAGICSRGRNVMGLMPNPERACEDSLGSSDGRAMFRSLAGALAGAAA